MHRVGAEVVDLARDGERVVELLVRVLLELAGYVLKSRGVELLTEDHVLNDRLVLAGEILLQSCDELFARDRRGRECLAWP